MKQKYLIYKEKLATIWKESSKGRKTAVLGAAFALILLLVIVSVLSSSTKMVPLYRDLTLQEVGQIKAELDARKVSYQLENGGTTITVPENEVESLLVDLASVGLPDSGSIDYSFFSENTSWGMTDNEFNMIKLDTMQTELANMIKGIQGIQDATVMINKPESPVFIGDQEQEASASIVVETEPGYRFENGQIRALYHLVSKSVPNLPTDNIVITDQNFNYFDLEDNNTIDNSNTYTHQQNVKQDIERDIQRRVQQMLGRMVGAENIIASVTADIDFTQENRVEELVEPADTESMEGLPVSVERITETYSGEPPAGGVTGAGEGDVTNYPAGAEGNNGEYEMMKETINNEFDRIQKNIVESPYKVRDLGIQVAIDNRKSETGENGEAVLLTAQEQATVEESVSSILNSIISTSIAKPYGEIDPQEKVSIVFQEFKEQNNPSDTQTPTITLWMVIAGGLLLFIIIVLIVSLLRKRKERKIPEEETYGALYEAAATYDVPDIDDEQENESTIRRKQLEKMAKDKPEDFAKLLRSWIAED
ncbi:flagellar basal-body MS-ring/collar protein FliF [Thalassobacillus hwangdonensis]|uniref:Flagellar M-ring protein n=1 Tax=Thalassobacillus hwangdonensis TaxID=546108 RepID=A0ABW3KWC1_9BACI